MGIYQSGFFYAHRQGKGFFLPGYKDSCGRQTGEIFCLFFRFGSRTETVLMQG